MVDWFMADGAPADDSRPTPPYAQVFPVVGPGYVGVSGRF
jgi:hypothetical protein